MDPDRWSCRHGVRPPSSHRAEEAHAEFARALGRLTEAMMNELKKAADEARAEADLAAAQRRRRRKTVLISVCSIGPVALGFLLIWLFPGWWLSTDVLIVAGLTLTGWSITRTIKDNRRMKRQR